MSADFQSKVDVGVGIAKRWYDEGVDVLGIPNSAIALALVKVAEEKHRHRHANRGSDLRLTGKVVRLPQHSLDHDLRPEQDDRLCPQQAGWR